MLFSDIIIKTNCFVLWAVTKIFQLFLRQNSEYGKRDTSRDRINRRAENEWWLRLFDRRLPGRAGIYRQQKLCGRHLCGTSAEPVGTPFAVYQRQYITDSIEDYIRTAQSGVITMTTDTYPVLRRIMAIYHQSGDDCSDDSVQRIADEVAMDAKSVRKYIAIGTLNERRVDFYRQYDENGEETGEDVTVDTTSQPNKLYFRSVLYNALYEAFDRLTYREQRTVAKHLGFCDTCWSTQKAVLINGEVEYRPIKPMPFEEISHSASRRSDKASERTYKNALKKMRKALCVK